MHLSSCTTAAMKTMEATKAQTAAPVQGAAMEAMVAKAAAPAQGAAMKNLLVLKRECQHHSCQVS